jgi:uncharacterized membrane protein
VSTPGRPGTDRAAPAKALDGVAAPADSLEVALAHVLQVGTYVSVGLIGVGSLLLIAAGASPTAGGPPFSIERIAGDVLALRPEGFLWLGILGIVATPGLRVVRALLGFLRRGERGMAWIAALVLVVIAAGVIVGVMAG